MEDRKFVSLLRSAIQWQDLTRVAFKTRRGTTDLQNWCAGEKLPPVAQRSGILLNALGFKVGTRVQHRDTACAGSIIEVRGDKVHVHLDNGPKLWCELDELI